MRALAALVAASFLASTALGGRIGLLSTVSFETNLQADLIAKLSAGGDEVVEYNLFSVAVPTVAELRKAGVETLIYAPFNVNPNLAATGDLLADWMATCGAPGVVLLSDSWHSSRIPGGNFGTALNPIGGTLTGIATGVDTISSGSAFPNHPILQGVTGSTFASNRHDLFSSADERGSVMARYTDGAPLVVVRNHPTSGARAVAINFQAYSTDVNPEGFATSPSGAAQLLYNAITWTKGEFQACSPATAPTSGLWVKDGGILFGAKQQFALAFDDFSGLLQTHGPGSSGGFGQRHCEDGILCRDPEYWTPGHLDAEGNPPQTLPAQACESYYGKNGAYCKQDAEAGNYRRCCSVMCGECQPPVFQPPQPTPDPCVDGARCSDSSFWTDAIKAQYGDPPTSLSSDLCRDYYGSEGQYCLADRAMGRNDRCCPELCAEKQCASPCRDGAMCLDPGYWNPLITAEFGNPPSQLPAHLCHNYYGKNGVYCQKDMAAGGDARCCLDMCSQCPPTTESTSTPSPTRPSNCEILNGASCVDSSFWTQAIKDAFGDPPTALPASACQKYYGSNGVYCQADIASGTYDRCCFGLCGECTGRSRTIE